MILAVAAVSWAQERLWSAYHNQDVSTDAALVSLLSILEQQLLAVPPEQREDVLTMLSAKSKLGIELMSRSDIAGDDTLAKLARGEMAVMQAGRNESWLLKQLDPQSVLALRYREPESARGPLDWSLAVLFYAVIALAVMLWIWPLTRDLRKLESATASFGNRNWHYRAAIKHRSQVFSLAETFRKMAARIDGLIASHKDLSNAVSHEIKTPLARMQFEIEAAQRASELQVVQEHLRNIKSDIAQLNALVAATLDYAVLERANMVLNIARHDFTTIVPAIVDSVRRSMHDGIAIQCNVEAAAKDVRCDSHLMETLLRNLLHNAARFAKSRIDVVFAIENSSYRLSVDDDGPGIPEADRERVFGSFVQLANAKEMKSGFGLGLAIVKRVVEWHDGRALVQSSAMGGARFVVTWPIQQEKLSVIR
ncbi:MAG TPA: ATP-binding protein [Steroidobacteraceae bacterium]|nr:ATP-binding protein [Steroidobacteraceae bacterium]